MIIPIFTRVHVRTGDDQECENGEETSTMLNVHLRSVLCHQSYPARSDNLMINKYCNSIITSIFRLIERPT